MVDDIGLDLHFPFSQREEKISVATSVCTGHSNLPLAGCVEMGSNSIQTQRKRKPHPKG